MLGSTLIDVVNTAMEETRDRIEQEMNLRHSVTCVEILGIAKNDQGRMKCGFSYTTMVATGEAEQDDSYRNFLQQHLRDAHQCLLKGESSAPVGWESSPVIMERIERKYSFDHFDYSIAVATLGGTREENETIVRAILHDIPEIG